MSITGVGSAGTYYPSLAMKAAAPQSASQDAGLGAATPNATDPAVQDFLAYAKESPAQRMEDAWLEAHGLTEKALAKMPADQQAAIRKEMAADIKKQIDEQMQQKTGAAAPRGILTNIVA